MRANLELSMKENNILQDKLIQLQVDKKRQDEEHLRMENEIATLSMVLHICEGNDLKNCLRCWRIKFPAVMGCRCMQETQVQTVCGTSPLVITTKLIEQF